MVGGFSRPRKDKEIKVSSGQLVKPGQILVRAQPAYKAGINVIGLSTLHARCCGKVFFTRKKTSKGRVRTFVNVEPINEKSAK